MQSPSANQAIQLQLEATRAAIESGAAVAALSQSPAAAPTADDAVVQKQAELMKDSELNAAAHQKKMNELTERNMAQNIQGRGELTSQLFKLTAGWLIFIATLIFLNGIEEFSVGPIRFAWHLSDSVVLAVIGATTTTVIGLFLIVTKYFFYIKDGDASKTADVQTPS